MANTSAMNEWRKPLTPPSCRGQTHAFHVLQVCLHVAQDNPGANAYVVCSCSRTSRKDVVSLIKNMLMIPRYLMMRVPGRKERGVIFTTVTELPPNERLERSERDRPSGSGLDRSKDETAGSERASRRPKEREWYEKKSKRRRGREKKKTKKGMEIPKNTQK